MFFLHSPEQTSDHLLRSSSSQSPPCVNGHHRSTISLHTTNQETTTFCFICFSNLLTNPKTPTIHISYAISQLSLTLSHPNLLTHIHFLVSPLIQALSTFDDPPIATQIIDAISLLSSNTNSSIGNEFVTLIANQISSGALGWSRKQLHMLHCFGVLMSIDNIDVNSHIKDKESLVYQLVDGLQLPSEEIRGEILFVLYKFSALQFTEGDVDGIEVIRLLSGKIMCLSLEALGKTQRDEVRMNCVAFLIVLVQGGVLGTDSMSLDDDDDDPMVMSESVDVVGRPCLDVLFAEAVKGPLLSTDSEVQIRTLELIFHYVSQESVPRKQVQVLVEENVADYIFEILRLSECKDQVINACIRVLDVFSIAEDSFRKRLVIGFPSVIQVLRYVGGVPCHPFQIQTLKLISSCVSDFPGMASTSQVTEIAQVLKKMLERHYSQEMGVFPEAFALICSVFVSLMKTPSFAESPDVLTSLKESLRHAVLACLSFPEKDSSQISHAVYLLNEVYAYCSAHTSVNKSSCIELRHSVIDVCASHLLPWFLADINEIHEEAALGIMETFHSILLHNLDVQVVEFAELLVSADWFSFSFGCLGNFSTAEMNQRVYLVLSSLVDVLLKNKTGSHITDALPCLPSDPQDLLFLLGQDSSNNRELASCQSAALMIFHTSWIYNDRLADDKLLFTSLEQYILVNNTTLLRTISDSPTMLHLVNLYSLCRSLQNKRYQISYSLEAERILFHLLNTYAWDLSSTDIHLESLKWLFQQENISKSLTYQIQKISQNNLIGNEVLNVYGEGKQRSLTYWFANLVSEGDNYAATLLVNMLRELAEMEEQENDDVISILNLMTTVVSTSPTASNQLTLNGIGNAIYRLVCGFTSSTFGPCFATLLLLIFNILASVQPEVLKDDAVFMESWDAVFIKLLNYLNLQDTEKHEGMMVVGILSLVLYHSSEGALVEASRSIVLNPYLVSAINTAVDVACSKGPALTQNQDESNIWEALAFMLPLYFFALRSLQIVLVGAVDWQTFFGLPGNLETLPVVCIHCHNLCRLMHFGTPQIKLIASYCLLELFSGLSEQMDRKKEQLQCSSSYLKSMKTILGGHVFYDDKRVATNSALCLSMIIGWEDMEGRTELLTTSSWNRFIAEEMSVSLAMPCSASSTFMNHHKPAVYVTVAMLRLKNKPEWLRSVFDESCISSMIQNLNGMNISCEIVILFQELMQAQLLNAGQAAKLNRVFQTSRKQMLINGTLDESVEEQLQGTVSSIRDHSEVCDYLVGLMVSNSLGHTSGCETNSDKKKQVPNEIEQFSKLLPPCKVYTRKKNNTNENRETS